MVRGISTREFGDRYGGIIQGISLLGFGYGRLSRSLAISNAAWRQTLDEACDENGNWMEGLEDMELSGDGMLSIRQHSGTVAAVGGVFKNCRSQWRLRKMGMSWKAQKRCVFILALVLLASPSSSHFSCNYEKYLWSFISAIEFRALDATISGDSGGTKEFDGVDDELLNKRSNEVICVSSSCIRCGIHDALYDDFAVWSRSCTKVVASRIVCCASIRNFQP